ncbi:MAG: M20/M25/M40 family metallo-hydrolase, partial [Candidatus Eremiobacteraeota bacterium]|nr:M20/M25/M40 family metallo-hydrolase [Candidatus Eremiobacteraeota bacterium]
KAYLITINGFKGGHSGMDIHLGRGNANKLMNRLLYAAMQKFDIRIGSIDGGGLRNAIPRESFSKIALPEAQCDAFEHFISQMQDVYDSEYRITDPEGDLNLQTAHISKAMSVEDSRKLIAAIYGVPNGIYRMSPDINDLVQTSNNLARVLVKEGIYNAQCLTRSSVDSEKMDLANAIKAIFELIGARVDLAGSYPGWAPNPRSKVVDMMAGLYREMFQSEPLVNACHAGLECGIIGQNYPEMEMISFGPNIRGAHSPDEKVQVSSVQKTWRLLVETLAKI